MKLVNAYIRTFMADNVINALKWLKIPRISALDVYGLEDKVDPRQFKISAELGSTYTTMAKIELIFSNEQVEKIREAILKESRTGYGRDGLITISPGEEAISIRTGKNELFNLNETSS